MSTTLPDSLATDDLTILLGLVAATFFLLNNLYKPQPLVHPILLGRQSDVGRARNPGESAIYRNYSTGLMGRFPTRPNKDVNVLTDLVRADAEGARTLWSTKATNLQLQDRVAALAAGFVSLARLKKNDSGVFLLLNDGIEFILSDLALASLSIVSYTVASTSILPSVFNRYPVQAIITNAAFLPQILPLITGQHLDYTIIVVDEVEGQVMTRIPSNIRVLSFPDVERNGQGDDKVEAVPPKFSDVFNISFDTDRSGKVLETQFTHESVMAGVVATRSLLPSSHALSSLDTVVSANSLSSIYGRVIAYTAIYDGANFTTITGINDVADERVTNNLLSLIPDKHSIPSPTVLFVKPRLFQALVSSIHERASGAVLYPIAMRHKRANIAEGFISKESLWDRLVFDGARATTLGEAASTLRCVVVSGGFADGGLQTASRIAFSVPVINCFMHPTVAGPVLATHPFDLQDFPPEKSRSGAAHVGPPSVNAEVKLTSIDDKAVENGEDPEGILRVRGPSVGMVVGLDEGWVETDGRFRVQTNGAFQPVEG